MEEKKNGSSFFFAAQNWVSMAFFTVMCALLVLQLASRYLFSKPLLFTEEFSRFCYVWIAFLGMAIAHKRGDHIKIDLFVGLFPPGVRRVLTALVDIISLAMLAYLAYWGVEYMLFNEYSVAASVDFPLYYVYAALPVSCALAVVNIAGRLFGKK